MPKRGDSVGLAEFQGSELEGSPRMLDSAILRRQPPAVSRLEWDQENKLIQEALV